MKRLLLIFALIMACSVQVAQAYIFSFSNHTDYPLKIGVQLLGINEPFEWIDIPPRQKGSEATKEFAWTAFGHSKPSLNGWKAGFALDQIRVREPLFTKVTTIDEDGNKIETYEMDYVKDSSGKPKLDENGKKQIQFGPIRNVVVTWVKSEAYDAIIKASALFADGLSDMASKVASAALGGVPMPEFKLSPIADAIGTMAKYSWFRDRHVDIVEDAEFSTPKSKSFKYLVEGRG